MPRYVEQVWNEDQLELGNLSRKDQRQGVYRAYVPDLLSSQSFSFEQATVAQLEDALQAIVRADERVGQAGAIYLNNLLIRSESIASSFIEGHVVGPRRLAVEDLLRRGDVVALPVIRNVETTSQAIAELADPARPITLHDLEQLQQVVAPHTNYGLRTIQNWIGGDGYSPLRADFVPAPPAEVPELVDDLLRFINTSTLNPIAKAAIAHAQFETIHPFEDGNGRTGRALIHTILKRDGAVRNILIPISTVFAANKDAYIHGLTSYRAEDSNLEPWITGFTTAIIAAANNAVLLAEAVATLDTGLEQQLVTYRENAGIRPAKPRADAAILKLIPLLKQRPVVTADWTAQQLGVSRQNAAAALNQLHEADILQKEKDHKGNIVCYSSRQHLDLLTLVDRRNKIGGGDTHGRNIPGAPALPPQQFPNLQPFDPAPPVNGIGF